MDQIINDIASGQIIKFKFKRVALPIFVKESNEGFRIVVNGWLYSRDGLEIFIHRKIIKTTKLSGTLRIGFSDLWAATHPQLGLLLFAGARRRDDTVTQVCKRILRQQGGIAFYAQVVLRKMASLTLTEPLPYKETKS